MCLRVDPSKGIEGTGDDIKLRTDAFGTNTYPVKDPKGFLVRTSPSLMCQNIVGHRKDQEDSRMSPIIT